MTCRDLVAFSLLPGSLRRKHAALLALAAGTAGTTDPLDLLLAFCCGRPGMAASAGTRADLDRRAGEVLARAAALGIRPVGRLDASYPAALAAVADAPVVLWVLGDSTALDGRLVAVVGSRAASPYGLEAAGRLGEDLARAGVTVVSGLARGCDAAAHRGALAACGRTVAVLGCGPDVCYPAEHADLLQAVRQSGAVVSEYPPGTPPRPGHFPLRNRIISGLCRAVVVVEASDRSGSLLTAGRALDQGRDVMAVPGPVFGQRHRGSHALLRDGARLVETAADVLEELGWTGGAAPPDRASRDPLLRAVPVGEDVGVDALALRTGWPATVILQRLLHLELAGAVRRTAGGRFVRVGR
jgi:DNA processing protein